MLGKDILAAAGVGAAASPAGDGAIQTGRNRGMACDGSGASMDGGGLLSADFAAALGLYVKKYAGHLRHRILAILCFLIACLTKLH